MRIIDQFRAHAFVHFGWIVAVLIAIIIGLLSIRLGPNDSVKDILNFAVSLTSLTLALVAIGQALISGGALSEAVGAVRPAVDDVTGLAKELSQTAKSLATFSEKIDVRTDELSTGIAAILAQTETHDPKIDMIRGPILSEEVLKVVPAAIKLSLYLAYKSFKAKKSFPNTGIFASKNVSFHQLGILTALSAFKLITTTTEKSGNHVDYLVTDLGSFSWLERRQEELATAKSDDSRKFLAEHRAEVDLYFGHS